MVNHPNRSKRLRPVTPIAGDGPTLMEGDDGRRFDADAAFDALRDVVAAYERQCSAGREVHKTMAREAMKAAITKARAALVPVA